MSTPLDAALYFERVCRQTHLSDDAIASVTDLVGQVMAQSEQNHIYYLGVGPAGLMGVIDASEMVDTYGCRDDEVRAFVQGGWETCAIREGQGEGVRMPLLNSDNNDNTDKKDVVLWLGDCP